MADSGSIIESGPIAKLTGTPVLAVYYRLAAAAPFPAAVDDVVAVYRVLLKTHKPEGLVLYGTSAGAVLVGEVAVRLKKDGIPMPAALGFFSGFADWTKAGDSAAFFGTAGLAGAAVPDKPYKFPDFLPYLRGHNPADPLLSPLLADLRGLPPTLNITGTRDLLLSDTARFHRALLKAGVKSELIVYEAMPRAFWYQIGTPESEETLSAMAEFFERQLDARAKK